MSTLIFLLSIYTILQKNIELNDLCLIDLPIEGCIAFLVDIGLICCYYRLKYRFYLTIWTAFG